MLVTRIMSFKEFDRLLKGHTLRHNGVMRGITSCKGFCFAPGGDADLIAGQYVTFTDWKQSIGVTFLIKDKKCLTKGQGLYADWFDTFYLEEWSTMEYNKRQLKPLYAWLPIDEFSYERMSLSKAHFLAEQ
jgi:hypothetical protein